VAAAVEAAVVVAVEAVVVAVEAVVVEAAVEVGRVSDPPPSSRQDRRKATPR